MGSILILIHYNGEWDDSQNYRGFDTVGIAVRDSCLFEELKTLVADRIKVNTIENDMVLKYVMKVEYQPMVVDNDASFEFYKELKSRETDYTKFPICVTMLNKAADSMNYVSNVGELNNEQVQRLRGAIQVGKRVRNMSFIDYANEAANIITSDVEMYTNKRKKLQYDEHDVICDVVEDGDVRVGQYFLNSDVLKMSLHIIALSKKFNFRVVKSCPERYYVACLDRKCGWFCKSSCVGKSTVFKVRKMMNVHTCLLDAMITDQRQATSGIVSECIKNKFTNLKTVYTPADVMRDMLKDFGVTLNYKQAWRSRRKAIDDIRGKPDESYQLVPHYLKLVKDANPGSHVDVSITEDMKFEFLFMSLFASIKGWNHCRPLVVVDGTFLKASYGGTLLTASVQDANGHILPLAFAIVDSENDLSYEWFFENLKKAIGIRAGMCIVSDRNESLVKAVTKVYPGVAQCFCIYHLGKNIKKNFKKNTSVVHQKFIAAAKAYTVDEFNKHMDELKYVDDRVVDYLKGVGFEHWARAHCPHNRFLSMTSNAAESVNAALRSARELPVTTLLECLRAMQQKWNVANGEEARNTFTVLTKRGQDMMEENLNLSFKMTVKKASDKIYQVFIGKSIFIVDLEKRVCTCNRFQLDELPCAHALCVLRARHEDAVSYCSNYYYKETMVGTYEENVYPVPCDGSWQTGDISEDDDVLPPVGRVKAGRPKITRNRSGGEYKRKPRKTKCGKCRQPGHNVKTCTHPPAEP